MFTNCIISSKFLSSSLNLSFYLSEIGTATKPYLQQGREEGRGDQYFLPAVFMSGAIDSEILSLRDFLL